MIVLLRKKVLMTLRAKCLDLKVNYENVKFKDNSEPYGVH